MKIRNSALRAAMYFNKESIYLSIYLFTLGFRNNYTLLTTLPHLRWDPANFVQVILESQLEFEDS